MQQTETNAFINTDVWKNYKTPINQKNKSFSKCLTQSVSTNENEGDH